VTAQAASWRCGDSIPIAAVGVVVALQKCDTAGVRETGTLGGHGGVDR
jgi:hypothetical protein